MIATAAALLLAGTLAAAPPPHIGQAVVIDGPTQGPVVSLLADVEVRSEVDGDVVALGGDVELGENALVHGDVVALGGGVRGHGTVEGRTVGTATLGILGLSSAARLSRSWAMRLIQVGLWMLAVGLLVAVAPRVARRGGAQLAARPFRVVLAGALALVVWLAVAGLGLALAATPLGVGILILSVAALLAAKVVGVAAVAWVGGGLLARVLPVPLRGESPRTGAALLGLALVAILPLGGELVWMAVNLAGIGAAVMASWGFPALGAVRDSLALR